MEVYCKRCNHWDPSHRAGQGPQSCPSCSSFLFRRVARPGPTTHLKPLLQTIFGMTSIIFMAFYAVVTAMPIGSRGRIILAVALYVCAIKLAYKSMSTSGGKIKFPELDPREFFGANMVPVVVYFAVFLWLPTVLIGMGLSGDLFASMMMETPAHRSSRYEYRGEPGPRGDVEYEEGWGAEEQGEPDSPAVAAARKAAEDRQRVDMEKRIAEMEKQTEQELAAERAAARKAKKKARWLKAAAFGGAGVLLLYAAMALVLFLRTNTTGGMFLVTSGVQLMRQDPKGYLVVSAMVVGTMVARTVFESPFVMRSIALAIPAMFAKAVVTMVAFGVCGLYARQNARLLDVLCDEEDWEPMGAPQPMADDDDPPLAPGRLLSAPQPPAAAPGTPVKRG